MIAILPMILYPLLGSGFVQIGQFAREHPAAVLVWGADQLPAEPRLIVDGEFTEEFCSREDSRYLVLTLGTGGASSAEQRLRAAAREIASRRVSAVLYFPENFAACLSPLDDTGTDSDRPGPEIFVNSASAKSRVAQERLTRVMTRWREAIVEQSLTDRDVPDTVTRPFRFTSRDTAEPQSKRAAVWARFLPFVVMIWALTGTFYPAVDLCAGEKERGTLETLLSSPALRSEIVIGKLLTIITFGAATAILNLVSIGATGQLLLSGVDFVTVQGAPGIGFPPPLAIFWILATLVPAAILFGAFSLAVAASAHSSKEAQYYLMPLLLATLPLMMLALLPTTRLDLGTSLIPVTGLMLLLRDLIAANYREAGLYFAPVVGMTCLYSSLAVRWAIDQFYRESILAHEGERWSLRDLIGHSATRGETPTVAAAICCGALLLAVRLASSFLIDAPRSWNAFALSTLASLVFVIALPAVIMAFALTQNPRRTLLLSAPRPLSLLMAAMLAAAIHPLGMGLASGVRMLYPLDAEVTQRMSEMAGLLHEAPGLWALLGVLALAPAICEELAFRGFILSGLRRGNLWAAILVSSLLFGATHGIIQQSMTTFAVGVVLAFVAIKTGSLFPAIVFHFLYNALSLLLMVTALPKLVASHTALSWIYSTSSQAVQYEWPATVAGCVLTPLLLVWFHTQTHGASGSQAGGQVE